METHGYYISTFNRKFPTVDEMLLERLYESLQGGTDKQEVADIEQRLLRKAFKGRQPIPLGVADGFELELTHKLYGMDRLVVEGGPVSIGLCPCAKTDNDGHRRAELESGTGHGFAYRDPTLFFPMLFYNNGYPLMVNRASADEYTVSVTAAFKRGGRCKGKVPLHAYNARDISRLIKRYPSVRNHLSWKDPKYEGLDPTVTFGLGERKVLEI